MNEQHVVVYYDPEAWAACPANQGTNGPTWQWGEEILIGFDRGSFKKTSRSHQHDKSKPFRSLLGRTKDGGESWDVWQPADEDFVFTSAEPRPRDTPLDCAAPGFLLRVQGAGYFPGGAFWMTSADKGASWQGPHDFGELMAHEQLAGKEFTARTAYLIDGPREMTLLLSAREPAENYLEVKIAEKTFVARTTDGGQSFHFVSWVIPWEDLDRAVMPAPVRLSPQRLVVALRRKSTDHNWLDCYGSEDDGTSWRFLSRIAETADTAFTNGNPPSLLQLADGRLCCAYGNRSRFHIAATFSADGGVTWSEPRILRDDFESVTGFADLGYVRLFQRPDGRCVAAYFWCTPQRPQTHIAATIFGV